MAVTVQDYLLRYGVPNVYVKLVNNDTDVEYISVAPATAQGLWEVLAVPAGTYTVFTSEVGPPYQWVATGDENYRVVEGSDGGEGFTIRAWDFSFDSAGIATGIELFTPTVGDIMMDVWVEFYIQWNSLAYMDLRNDSFGALAGGLFEIGTPGPVDMGNTEGSEGDIELAGNQWSFNYNGFHPRILVAHPLKLYVTTGGRPSDPPSAATTGSARLYIATQPGPTATVLS